jgi:hypothetical protein
LAEARSAPCQVRNKTGNPCPRRAEVKILGVNFCGPCAREQEAYFAIGELADDEAQDFRGEGLAEALKGLRRNENRWANRRGFGDTLIDRSKSSRPVCGPFLELAPPP